ncbi:MAG: RagB/SusD family nutrient uptake outer membrane protein [Agriterribacter sp.]
MKRLFYTYNLLLLSIALLSTTGCKKFLDEQDPTNFTQSTFYTKIEHAQIGINAIYAPLRDPISSGFGGGAWMMLEFATGLAATDLGQAVNSYFVKDLVNTAANGYGYTYWQSYYKGIANANLAIQKIPAIPGITDDQSKKYLGEAYFLRAFYYFNLVQMFGNIPLVTEPVDLSSPQFYAAQSTPAEVYDLIVSDLTTAEQAGLSMKDETGRASLGAIKTLLAKVYLTMAGYPLQKGNSYYTLAAQKAREVMDSGAFKLFASYSSLHDPSMKNKEENIFMIQYLGGTINGSWQSAIIPYNKNISAYSDETGGIYSTATFVNTFEANDLRAKEKEFFFTQFTNEKDRNQVVDLGGYFIYKLFDSVAQTSTTTSNLNWCIYRYADLLLTYAEASNETEGPAQAAYDAVNAIRSRAQLPALSGLTKDQLREAIWRERWHELCFENLTWFDMVRLRKAYNETNGGFDDYVGHKFSYGTNLTLTKRELLFPIPSDEVLNGKLTQNEGY